MLSRSFLPIVILAALAAALPAHGESGLRVPQRGEPGLDPSFARGWLAPDFDRFGFAAFNWKEAIGFAPSQRMNWSYAFGGRGSLGMSYANGRDVDPVTSIDGRQFGLFGRYAFAQDWSLSAEAVAREPGTLFRLHDLRIGVQRQF
jgi:hypothetical protein